MKARTILGVGLLATLLLAPVRIEAQPKDELYFQVISLHTLEAKTVVKNLQTLFDVDKGPAPTLDFDASRNIIMVRGTAKQVAQVKGALEKLGEQGQNQSLFQQLTAMQQSLEGERRNLEAEHLASMRDLDVRQNQLKRELGEIAAKRAALERAFSDRGQVLQRKIDEVAREIQSLKATAAPPWFGQPQPPTVTGRESMEAKLDQILSRLKAMETRLDGLEKAAKRPQFGPPLPK